MPRHDPGLLRRLRELLGQYTPDWRTPPPSLRGPESLIAQPDATRVAIQSAPPAGYYGQLSDQSPWAAAGVSPIAPPMLPVIPQQQQQQQQQVMLPPPDATRVALPQEQPRQIPQTQYEIGRATGQMEPLPEVKDAVFPSLGEGPVDVGFTALSRAYENVERFGAGVHNTVGKPVYGAVRGAAAMVPGGMSPSEGWEAGEEQAARIARGARYRADMAEYRRSGIDLGGNVGKVEGAVDLASFMVPAEGAAIATSALARRVLPTVARRAAQQMAAAPRGIPVPGAAPATSRQVLGQAVQGISKPTMMAGRALEAHVVSAMRQDDIAAGGLDPSEHFLTRLGANVAGTAATSALFSAFGRKGSPPQMEVGTRPSPTQARGLAVPQVEGPRPGPRAGEAVTAETLEGVPGFGQGETPRLRLQGPVVGQDPRLGASANKAALRLRDEGIREFPAGGTRTVYHGVAPRHAEDIAFSGEVRSHLLGGQKTRGGTVDEVGLIWVSPTGEMAEGWSTREIEIGRDPARHPTEGATFRSDRRDAGRPAGHPQGVGARWVHHGRGRDHGTGRGPYPRRPRRNKAVSGSSECGTWGRAGSRRRVPAVYHHAATPAHTRSGGHRPRTFRAPFYGEG